MDDLLAKMARIKIPCVPEVLEKPPMGYTLIDPTPEELTEFAKAHSGDYVMTFLTGPIEDIGDYNCINKFMYYGYAFCERPIYIGNFRKEDHERIIEHCVKAVNTVKWESPLLYKQAG